MQCDHAEIGGEKAEIGGKGNRREHVLLCALLHIIKFYQDYACRDSLLNVNSKSVLFHIHLMYIMSYITEHYLAEWESNHLFLARTMLFVQLSSRFIPQPCLDSILFFLLKV